MTVKSFIQSAGGIDWYCETRGAGPWVVLIPSGEGDCSNYAATAEALAKTFSVLTFDTPGFSRTSAPSDPDAIAVTRLSGQIAALIRSLGIEQATFYGCSSGGRAVLDLICNEASLVRNGVVHEAALPCPAMDAQLAKLAPVPDEVVPAVCEQLFANVMNEDQAAWAAQGDDYHARLQRNYVTWVRHYVRPGLGTLQDATPLRARPIVWTIGALGEREPFVGNFELAEAAGLEIGTLPCRHFPQVSIPALLAEHIASATAPHLQ